MRPEPAPDGVAGCAGQDRSAPAGVVTAGSTSRRSTAGPAPSVPDNDSMTAATQQLTHALAAPSARASNPRTSRRPLRIAVAAVLAITALAGCKTSTAGGTTGSSAPSASASASASSLSLSQKFTTIQVCANVAGDLRTLGVAAAKAATGQASQSDLAAQLAPLQTQLTALAQANASLPIGQSLMSLSQAISALSGLSSSAPADIASAGKGLVTSVQNVLTACLAVKS